MKRCQQACQIVQSSGWAMRTLASGRGMASGLLMNRLTTVSRLVWLSDDGSSATRLTSMWSNLWAGTSKESRPWPRHPPICEGSAKQIWAAMSLHVAQMEGYDKLWIAYNTRQRKISETIGQGGPVALEYLHSIGEAKWHPQEFTQAKTMCDDGYFWDICCCHRDLVVSREKVDL